MNSTRISKLILSLLFLCLVTTGRAQTFPRLLLGGDYPDPSIIREGKDFIHDELIFLIMLPGLLVWHSTDLVNWTPIARALHALDGSVYAPDLVKYKGRYYIYYPAAGANYVVYADNIRGPWSQPVKLDLTGIDPGHVVGEDGKRYLYVDKGAIAPLSDDGLKVTGPKKTSTKVGNSPKNGKPKAMATCSSKVRNCCTRTVIIIWYRQKAARPDRHEPHGGCGTFQKRVRPVGKLSLQSFGAYL